MLQKFKNYITQNNLLFGEEKILLAVSGGIDSTVMLHLFSSCKFKFGIAHCNFGLRGKESDGDEEALRKLAKKYKSEFHSVRFETEKHAKTLGISIQMAARELRYKWFEKIRTENKINRIIGEMNIS